MERRLSDHPVVMYKVRLVGEDKRRELVDGDKRYEKYNLFKGSIR